MIGRRNKPSTTELDKPKGFDDYDLRLGDVMRGERATLGKSLLDVQRELKIKAAYIAAIENADISAFETQGFVAGYVRSYARYLGMDPDWAFQRFCKEANFEVAHGMSAAASSSAMAASRTRSTQEFRDPLANPNATFVPRGENVLSRIEPGAVGSLVVLVALIGAIGYGGWSVLQEVQRVQLAPVDQAPAVVAEIDPLGNVTGAAPLVRSAPESEATTDLAAADPVKQAEGLDRLYRPQALDVPVMVSRDGPIASINPRANDAATGGSALAIESAVAEVVQSASNVQVIAAAQPGVEILAVRPSWVRVQAADGTVLFEKILDAGERWAVPQLEEAPLLRSGNSGSVYFAVNGQTYGPAAPGAQVIKNVALSPEALTDKYAVADLTVDPDLAAIVAVADAGSLVPPVQDPATGAVSE
jgi:cytoskeletal protein RodZ